MDPPTQEETEKELYELFLKERSDILEEIEEFLAMVLNYFFDLEQKLGLESVVTAVEKNLISVNSLIKSLCLIHGLYGYPAEIDKPDKTTPLEFNANIDDIIYCIANTSGDAVSELTKKAKKLLRDTVINKNAVKNILLNKIKRKIVTKDKENKTIKFEDYCGKEVKTDKFWTFTFDDETFSLESLPREPAHFFLQLVRGMFNDTNHGEALSTVGRVFLEQLPGKNSLKPKVWAHQISKPENFGVSLGVQKFVRPLYLCIKLTQLNNVEKCKLEDVKAIKMRDNYMVKDSVKDSLKDSVKDPCVSCQKFFGFKSFPLLGNCAEYDVIENVNHTDLLQTPQWDEFRSACQQHFDAFKTMLKKLKGRRRHSSKYILKDYYDLIRGPKKPNVLKYEWNPDSKGFELKNKDWPQPR